MSPGSKGKHPRLEALFRELRAAAEERRQRERLDKQMAQRAGRAARKRIKVRNKAMDAKNKAAAKQRKGEKK